jgi:hypothetical protein
MALKTRRKASGRCQAATNAAIAPLLLPAIARSLGSLDSVTWCVFATCGSSSSSRKRA